MTRPCSSICPRRARRAATPSRKGANPISPSIHGGHDGETDGVGNAWGMWWMGAGPGTLPAAIAPVLVGTAAAVEWAGKLPRVGAFIAALIRSGFLTIGTNLANEHCAATRG